MSMWSFSPGADIKDASLGIRVGRADFPLRLASRYPDLTWRCKLTCEREGNAHENHQRKRLCERPDAPMRTVRCLTIPIDINI